MDDYIVRMPPISSYPIRVKIKSVTKGTPRFVGLEDEVMDAMEICEWDKLSDEALENFEGLLAELKLKTHVLSKLDKETLEEFEKMVDESSPPEIVDGIQQLWTEDDWMDWLMGK